MDTTQLEDWQRVLLMFYAVVQVSALAEWRRLYLESRPLMLNL